MSPEYLKAVAELVNSIAWPFIFLVFLVLYRKRLSNLLERVEEFKLGSASARIRRELDNVGKTVPENAQPTPPNEQQLESAQRIEELSLSTDMGEVRRQLFSLAREYEKIRAALPSGDTRTRRMEVITTKMRSLGLACYPYLPELSDSYHPGDRLAAVAILQVKPHIGYLTWLADRLKEEKPFIGYHAAIALLVAARSVDPQWRDDILSAVMEAKKSVEHLKHSDRYRILEDTQRELSEKET